jgi:hydroxypyruvate reductase
LLVIVRSAIEGASTARAVSRALEQFPVPDLFSAPVHVMAVGKAADAMSAAAVDHSRLHIERALAIGTHASGPRSPRIEWHEAAHPVPDRRSVVAAERALQFASDVRPDQWLLILLSGGASSLMALPASGITLEDKQQAVRTMLLAGADIHALNTVRKHLSGIKGGRLAAACRGATVTLAVSDVLDDDLSVIGSGPGVGDVTTWAGAHEALEKFGGMAHSSAVRALVQRGVRGDVPESPKPGDPALARARALVIASRHDAVAAARDRAIGLGYHVLTIADAVCGEARDAAAAWFGRAKAMIQQADGPCCVLSAGETTVRVTGSGRGGRNQEFVLALADAISRESRDLIVASVGTDGIDGPTDAAGALVDPSTSGRAAAIGLAVDDCLADNNSYDFFACLGDLIHLGRTDTNVGDLQVLLMKPSA